MTPRLSKSLLAAWTERWSNETFVLGNPSPFGVTATGAKDYRGVRFEDGTLENVTIADADLTAARLDHLRLVGSTFRNCIFDRAILTQLVTHSSRFDDCRFYKADLRIARIGYHGTDFSRCRFDGARLARASFLNATFVQIDFQGKDWSHTDFGVSGFRDCSFNGVVRDVVFRGDYLLPSHREIAGEPKGPGLRGVSFEKAELHWVNFANGCTVEEVVLPADGSAFLCLAKDLIALHVDLDQESKEGEVFGEYLRIIRPDAGKQAVEIVSRNDLVKVGGEEIGTLLYALVRSRLASN